MCRPNLPCNCIERSLYDRRLFARIGYAFMADLTYI